MSPGPAFDPVSSPYLVPFDRPFDAARAPTRPPKGSPDKQDNQEALADAIARLAKQQELLYADDRFSMLVVFQALDAAGKDGTLRAVLSGINPAGCQVFSFKAPTTEELEHDFLWRCHRAMPERRDVLDKIRLGDIGILLVEQYLDFAEELGDRFSVMERGRVVVQGLKGEVPGHRRLSHGAPRHYQLRGSVHRHGPGARQPVRACEH